VLNIVHSLLHAALVFFRTRRQLAMEVLALRRQLGVLKRSVKRPPLTNADRGLWVLLSGRWASWSDALIIVKPATAAKTQELTAEESTHRVLVSLWAGTRG
jgi:hypothetical protein